MPKKHGQTSRTGIASYVTWKYHNSAPFTTRELYNPTKRTAITTSWHTQPGSRALSRSDKKLWPFKGPEPRAAGDVGRNPSKKPKAWYNLFRTNPINILLVSRQHMTSTIQSAFRLERHPLQAKSPPQLHAATCAYLDQNYNIIIL